MPFSPNQKILMLMAEAQLSGGFYNQRPKGPSDADHSKGSEENSASQRRRQPVAEGRETESDSNLPRGQGSPAQPIKNILQEGGRMGGREGGRRGRRQALRGHLS